MRFSCSTFSRLRCAAAVLSGATLLLTLVPAAGAQTLSNPIARSGADPWVLQWGGQYFYTSTTGSDVRLSRSPWLEHVASDRHTVWNPPTNTPYGHNLWAPELHRLNDKWYLYVAADDRQDFNHRMYVLEGDSQDPQGSYTLKGQVSIPSNRWAIDGTVFEHGDKDYFIWSGRTFSTDTGSSQSLYIAEMSDPWTLTGTRTRISTPTYTWERHGHPVNEGPQILRNPDGEVFLTYSASGFYTPQYAIGALKLTGTNPLSASAWQKLNQPLFDQGNGVEGTGHASFVKSKDGTEDWIVYHARTAPEAPRDLRIQPFSFGADGVPQFGEPVPTGQHIAAPSGVPVVTFIPNMSFERGGAGWLDEFRTIGDAGAHGNDAPAIAGADGLRVGYLGVGIDSGLYQDIGPAHAGTYTLGIDIALPADQASLAEQHSASFFLQLLSVGTHPGGSANEADIRLLGQREIRSSQLDIGTFRPFDFATLLDADEIGRWLRVGIYAPNEAASSAVRWTVALDWMTLGFAASSPTVPEPAAGAGLCLVAWLGTRRARRPTPRTAREIHLTSHIYQSDCIQV